jgi:hypothetical protein
VSEDLLLEPLKYLAIYMLGIHVPTEACVENDVVGFIPDVSYLGWFAFFVVHQAGEERLPASIGRHK